MVHAFLDYVQYLDHDVNHWTPPKTGKDKQEITLDRMFWCKKPWGAFYLHTELHITMQIQRVVQVRRGNAVVVWAVGELLYFGST